MLYTILSKFQISVLKFGGKQIGIKNKTTMSLLV